MHRNLQVSKQTEDKVKLAKQFIQSRYKDILFREQQQRIGWQKIIKALEQTPIPETQKKAVADKARLRQSSKTRLLRVKDRLENYELLGVIGKGAFGEVRLVRSKQTQQVMAIKRMAKSKLVGKKQVASVFLERECLSRSHSPWLVQLKSAFQDQDHLYIAMQWVPGGDLLRLLIEKDIFTECETRFYVSELILAIEEMHKIHYIHRDIKPDNILIAKDGHLKLTDFGLSKEFEPATIVQLKKNMSQKQLNNQPRPSLKRLFGRKQRQFSKVGTPDYIAPQVLTETSYDQRVDIWSVGVIMFQCLFGYPPFSHQDSKEVCQRVIHWEDHLTFPDTPKVSLQAKLLILGMLTPREHRLSIAQIKVHPFFIGYNWDKVTQMKPPFLPQLDHLLDTRNFDTFEQQSPWHQSPMTGSCERLSHVRRSSSVGYQYNFAGFDWQPKPAGDPFAQTLKEIQNMQKKRPPSGSPHMKRMNTEQNHTSHAPKNRQLYKGRNSVKAFQMERPRRDDKLMLKKVIRGKQNKNDI